MNRVEEIEQAVERLSPEEMATFNDWFEAFKADAWDRQIENDVQTGKLDWLTQEAQADIAAGRSKPCMPILRLISNLSSEIEGRSTPTLPSPKGEAIT